MDVMHRIFVRAREEVGLVIPLTGRDMHFARESDPVAAGAVDHRRVAIRAVGAVFEQTPDQRDVVAPRRLSEKLCRFASVQRFGPLEAVRVALDGEIRRQRKLWQTHPARAERHRVADQQVVFSLHCCTRTQPTGLHQRNPRGVRHTITPCRLVITIRFYTDVSRIPPSATNSGRRSSGAGTVVVRPPT